MSFIGFVKDVFSAKYTCLSSVCLVVGFVLDALYNFALSASKINDIELLS